MWAIAFLASGCSAADFLHDPVPSPGTRLAERDGCRSAGQCFVFSANGSHLYFAMDASSSGTAPRWTLSVAEPGVDSWQMRTIGPLPGLARQLAVSSDSTMIYMSVVVDSVTGRTRLFGVRTVDATAIVLGDGADAPFAVSEDGRFVAFVAQSGYLYGGDTIVVLDRANGGRSIVHALTTGVGALSADGSEVVYAGPGGFFLKHLPTGATELLPYAGAAAAVDGDWRVLFRSPSRLIDWSRSTQHADTMMTANLLTVAWAPKASTVVAVEGGGCLTEGCAQGRAILMAFVHGIGSSFGSSNTFDKVSRPQVALSPDGRWFAYRSTTGIYLLQAR